MEVIQKQVHWLLVSFLHDEHPLNRKYNFIPFVSKFNECFLSNLNYNMPNGKVNDLCKKK